MSRRAMLIGIDGATFDLIKPWADEGKLPHFKRWLDEGSHAVLRSTIHPLTPHAWTSIFTGVNAGRHGVYDFGTFDISKPYQPFNASTIGSKPIWQLLSDRELPVIVINAIGTYPPKPLQGALITGRMTPLGEPYTWPRELAQEIADQVGEYIIDVDPNQAPHLKEATESEFLDHLLAMVRSRTATTLYLARKYPWRLLTVVYMAVDVVQHYYWRHIDPEHPDHVAEVPDRIRNAILLVYQEIDRSLQALEEFLDEHTTAFIVSDHGFGPWYAQANLTRWLVEQGYLTLREESPDTKQENWLLKIRQRLRDAVPSSIRQRLRGYGLRGVGLPAQYQTMKVDWSRTRVYTMGDFGNLFINLAGREPLGIVPLDKRAALCDELVEKLKLWKNPRTGSPLVKAVHARETLFEGPFATRAPDLLIEWADYTYAYHSTSGVDEPFVAPLKQGFYKHLRWSGMHRLDGVFMCKSGCVKASSLPYQAKLVDIAPTVLHSMALSVPEGMDGRVFQEIIRSHVDIVKDGINLTVETQPGDLSEEKSSAIQDRLKGLGYLE